MIELSIFTFALLEVFRLIFKYEQIMSELGVVHGFLTLYSLESIYLYFPPSSQIVYLCFCPVRTAGTTVENKGKLILTEIFPSVQKH